MRARTLLGLLIPLACAALFVRLGFWQISRHQERVAVLRSLEARLQAEPVEFSTTVAHAADPTWTLVRVEGRFRYDLEQVQASAFFGVGSTPLLEGDRLIVMLGAQTNAGVVALDAATGRTLWESVGKSNWDGVTTVGWRAENPYRWSGVEKQASYCSPVAATIHGRRHIFCLMRQGLVSLNPTNGEVNFSRWFQSMANDSVNAMCPVVQDDMVMISAAYFRVGSVLLRVKPDGKSFEEVWRIPQSPMQRDPASGSFVQPTLEIHWNTPVLRDGFLYAFSGRNEPDATFRCVELKTGKVMWSRDEKWAGHEPGAQPPVFGRGSAILADGKLIALGEGGLLGLFKPDSKAVVELARWQVPQLGFPCWAAPILSRKKLYLRSENHLVCVDLEKR